MNDVDIITRQIIEKANQYLSGYCTLLENSKTINEIIPITFKEKIHTLIQSIPQFNGDLSLAKKHPYPLVTDNVHFLNSFMTLSLDIDSTISSECLDLSQNL